jgi:hypothetical protein
MNYRVALYRDGKFKVESKVEYTLFGGPIDMHSSQQREIWAPIREFDNKVDAISHMKLMIENDRAAKAARTLVFVVAEGASDEVPCI